MIGSAFAIFIPGLASNGKFFVMAGNDILENNDKKSTTKRSVTLSTSDNGIEKFLEDEANKYTQRNTHSDLAEIHKATLINDNSEIFVD